MSCNKIKTCFRYGTDYQDRLISFPNGIAGLSNFRYEITQRETVTNLTVGNGLDIIGDKVCIQGDALESLLPDAYDTVFWLDINGQTRDLFSEDLEISADKCDCANVYNLSFTIIPVDISENVVNIYLSWEDLTPEQILELQQPAIDAGNEVRQQVDEYIDAKELQINPVILAAEDATQEANDAAQTANTAAENADEKATAAQTAANNANDATSAANTATTNANDATLAANTATTNANNATLAANTAATNAQDEADAAQQINTNVQLAENIRISNENTRQSQESTRQTNESGRVNAENTRVSNESTRVTSENTRVSTENTRVSNETGRINAESARVLAENSRVSAESARVTSSATAVTNANNAADNANNAANNANAKIIELANDVQAPFKTLNVGSGGMVTITPTTRYGTYRLTVLENVLINFDLSKMLAQIGSARARIIIDMPIVRTITFAKPVLFGGTPPTFPSAGQYIFEVVDVDGTNTPLIWQVASTLKAQATGNILYVDSTGADYSTAQINAGTVTRTNSSWANPFKYLQNAINAAIAGDVIFVKAGTYYPTHLQNSATYSAGDYQNRNACFTMKAGVDVYGGFLGTESRTWQRKVNANGRMINLSVLNGDIRREAVIDSAKTIGDLRTDGSKANAAYSVIYANVASYTYLDGFDVTYGNSAGNGGGINSTNTNFVGKNNRVFNNTSSNGGGWRDGTYINCSAYNNTGSERGGGWYLGTSTNCTAYNNTSSNGGGWHSSTSTNCTAYNNNATSGGGWYGGTNTNCSAYNNTAALGGGWREGTNTNCTAYNNTASSSGGGWMYGTNINCSAYNNTGTEAVYVHSSAVAQTEINNILFNNRTPANAVVGYRNAGTTPMKIIFRNNAYDTVHPTIGSTEPTSDINYGTCLQNVTLAQIKIELPSFVGAATNSTQRTELETFAANMVSKLKPKSGSILKGAGINNATYPNATDFEGTPRPTNSTIGILEGL